MRGVTDTLRDSRPSVLPQLLDGCIIGFCPVGTPEGLCGGELSASLDTQSLDWWAHCRTCKTSALVDWWFGRTH